MTPVVVRLHYAATSLLLDCPADRRRDRALEDLAHKDFGVLRLVDGGRAVTVAEVNCNDWIDICGVRLNGWERGGSRSDTEQSEAAEVRKVHRQALRDVGEFDGLSRSIAAGARVLAKRSGAELHASLVEVAGDCRRLAGIVARYVVPVDHSSLPAKPGCRSCARVGEFVEVYEKSVSSGLCRWCLDHRDADGGLPAVMAVGLRHRQSPRAAGVWLARQQGVKAS